MIQTVNFKVPKMLYGRIASTRVTASRTESQTPSLCLSSKQSISLSCGENTEYVLPLKLGIMTSDLSIVPMSLEMGNIKLNNISFCFNHNLLPNLRRSTRITTQRQLPFATLYICSTEQVATFPTNFLAQLPPRCSCVEHICVSNEGHY